jgi:hypothetical protein
MFGFRHFQRPQHSRTMSPCGTEPTTSALQRFVCCRGVSRRSADVAGRTALDPKRTELGAPFLQSNICPNAFCQLSAIARGGALAVGGAGSVVDPDHGGHTCMVGG